jgi:hypothetical protein
LALRDTSQKKVQQVGEARSMNLDVWLGSSTYSAENKTLKIKRFQRLVDETMQGFAFMQGILEDFDI